MRTCVRIVIVCVLLPRFELAVAAGSREVLLRKPAALAPEPGAEQFTGEVSLAAEAFGVRRGMRLGEALARCPHPALVPPDPMGVADAWDSALERLEGMGAAVESERPGLACFDARGLLRMHHGRLEAVLDAAREALLRRPPGAPAVVPRLGAGPTRFIAVAAASRARPRRPELLAGAQALPGATIAPRAPRET